MEWGTRRPSFDTKVSYFNDSYVRKFGVPVDWRQSRRVSRDPECSPECLRASRLSQEQERRQCILVFPGLPTTSLLGYWNAVRTNDSRLLNAEPFLLWQRAKASNVCYRFFSLINFHRLITQDFIAHADATPKFPSDRLVTHSTCLQQPTVQ